MTPIMERGREETRKKRKGGRKMIVNLTPHDIVVYDAIGEKALAVIPKSGKIARVVAETTEIGNITIGQNRISIVSTNYGQVVVVDDEGIEKMPPPSEETIYLISVLVVQVLKGSRRDVVTPDTGPESVVRDAEGKILGVRRFTQ